MAIRKKFYGKIWTKSSTGFKTKSEAVAEARHRDKVSKEATRKWGGELRKYIVKKMEPPIAAAYAPFVIFTRKITK